MAEVIRTGDITQVTRDEFLRNAFRTLVEMNVARGEQPDNQALPVDGAMRGAEPISLTDQREEQ